MRRTFVEKSLYLSTLKNVNIVKFWDFTQSPARLTDNYLVSYCHSWTSLYGPFVCMTSFLLSQVIFQHRNYFLWLEIYFEYRLSLYIASLFIPPLSLYRLSLSTTSLSLCCLSLYIASLFIPPLSLYIPPPSLYRLPLYTANYNARPMNGSFGRFDRTNEDFQHPLKVCNIWHLLTQYNTIAWQAESLLWLHPFLVHFSKLQSLSKVLKFSSCIPDDGNVSEDPNLKLINRSLCTDVFQPKSWVL